MSSRPNLLLFVADAAAGEQVAHALETSGGTFDLTTVTNGAGLAEELGVVAPDLVIADPSQAVPGGETVLGFFWNSCPGVPVVIVSPTEGEEAAVEALHAGAADFLYRGRLGRLTFAVKRSLREAAARSLTAIEKGRARVNNQRYRYFLEHTTEGLYRIDFEPPINIDQDQERVIAAMYANGSIAECNRIFAQTYGFSDPVEMIGTRLVDLHGGSDITENVKALRKFIEAGYRHLGVETVEVGTDGQPIYLSNNSVGIVENNLYVSCWGTQSDVSKQRIAEKMVRRSRGHLRALLARLRRAQEDERILVARHIHDELGQLLTGLKMDVRWIEERLSAPDVPTKFNPLLDRVVAAAELIDQTVAAVQAIAARLRPGALDHLGLAAALSMRAREFEERSDIPCSFATSDPPPEVPSTIANELYYICQEALTNIARHAEASSVEIGLRQEGSEIVLEVNDDGVGIDLGSARSGASLGITGMEERALGCGGAIDFALREPQGTKVAARVPLNGDLSFEGGLS